MAITKVLALTVEQAEEFVNGLQVKQRVSAEEPQSNNVFQGLKDSLKNGYDALRQKLGRSSSEKEGVAEVIETETVKMLVKEPVQAVENPSIEHTTAAPQKMSDYQYRCYLNSVVFGE